MVYQDLPKLHFESMLIQDTVETVLFFHSDGGRAKLLSLMRSPSRLVAVP